MSLTRAEARRVAVAAQGLDGRTRTLPEALDAVQCVQVDAISVVRRSQELVGLARGVTLEDAGLLGTADCQVATFEYWGHAISILPIDLWPAMAVRRRSFLRHGWRGPEVDPGACDHVRRRLAAEGGLTLRDLGGSVGSGWERSSPNRWAAEWLQATGEAVVLERRGNQRVYALTEQVLPSHLIAGDDLTDRECLGRLVTVALRALGVGTTEDVADYFRLPPAVVESTLHDLDAQVALVEGIGGAWLSKAASSTAHDERGEPRSIPLSPFDSLVWHRPRQKNLFGRDWLLEAYKPATKRQFGYFSMPILSGNELAGRIAARRGKDKVLVVEAFEWDPSDADAQPTEVIGHLVNWTRARDVVVHASACHPALELDVRT
ncbi:MAG: crosslink repair DNA glycosylase YcaQ family protein [Kineosporiaceae bacterium]